MSQRLSSILSTVGAHNHVALELEQIHAPARTGDPGLLLYMQVTPLIRR